MNFIVRFIGSLIKYLVYISVIIIAAGAALFWFDTGSWLVKPLAEHAGSFFLAPAKVEISNVSGSLRNGYSVSGLKLISGDRDLLTLNHFSVSPDWDLVLAGMDGIPFIRQLNVQGVSTDLDNVMAIASIFPPSSEDKPEPIAEPFNLKLNPANISVKDIFFGSPYANLNLKAMTLNEAGKFLLDAKISSGDNVLPLTANASLNLPSAEITSSDIRIGSKGKGKFIGKIQPLNAKLFLSALQLEDFMRLLSPDMKVSGRIDAKISALANDNDGSISASGVLSMPRAEVLNIPLNFRLPFTWNGTNIFTLDNATFSTKAAAFNLSVSGDIERMRFTANGEGKNISLTEIGTLFAPDMLIKGENGHVKFDIDTEYSEDVMQMLLQRTRASVAANLPSVSAMGFKTAENLSANVKLIPNLPPKIAMGGKAFGGKIFARGEATKDSDGNILPHSVVMSIVGLDIPSLVGTFPEVAKAVGKTSGKITATARISESLNIRGKITSDKLSAYGVTLSGLNADMIYDLPNNTAELEDFSANLGKGRISAKSAVNLVTGIFTANANASNIELRNIPQLKGVSGAYSLKADASGNFNDIKSITANALLTARNAGYDKITKGNIDVPVTFSRGVLRVSDASIRFPGSSAKVKAEADINSGNFTANADAENLDLRFIPQLKDLKGKYSLTADASGNFYDIKTITAAALLTAQNAGYTGYNIGNAEIPVTFRNNILTVSNAHAELPQGSVTLEATANLNESTFKANADVQNLELRFIPELKDVKGQYSLRAGASGHFTDINAITANASISARNAGYQGMSFGNADIPLTFRNGTLFINTAKASLPGGNLTAKGSVNLRNINNPLLDVTASTGGINISRLLDGLNIENVPVSGNFKGSVSVKGRADNPSVSVRANASDIKATDLADIPSAELAADGNMKRIDIKNIKAKVNGAEISGKGVISPKMNNIMASGVNIDTTVKNLDLKALLKKFMEKAPVEGVIDAKAGVTGTLSQPTAYLTLTKPILYQKSEINDVSVSVKSPEPDHFLINAKARINNFKPESDIDIRIRDDGIFYAVNTKPLDINSAVESQMPEMSGMAKGFAVVNVKGSTRPHDNISINAKSDSITVMDKIKITDINIPVMYLIDSGKVEMRKARAKLSGGIIESRFDFDTVKNEWSGHADVSHLDFGKLAQPFMPEGELVGSVDMKVDMKGSSPMGMTLSFADGKFKTGPGCIQKIKMLESITPGGRITFEEISGSFFWNGKDLFLNPGTGARAGIKEPLYRYVTVNGSAGIPGKGLKLLFDGRFDMKLLDQLLGAMKGVFQYMTGSLARNVLRDAASRVMGLQGKDFQNVSFTLANSWNEPHLRDLKVTKPIEDFLPIDVLNKDEEKQKDTTQFKMSFKLPVGEGAPSAEDESPKDQFKRQLIDNLFNIGM